MTNVMSEIYNLVWW